MRKGETFFEKTNFSIGIVFKILTPPVYSFERLENYCKARIKKNQKAYSPRWFLADLYKHYQKNEEAKKEYLEIKHLGYMTDSEIHGLGEVLFKLQDYHRVIETLAPIIDKYPRHKNANGYLGISYMKKEEYQKAVIYLEKVIIAGSKLYEDYWHLGYCNERIGRLEDAKKNYLKALSIKPDSLEVKYNLALVIKKIGQTSYHNLDEAEEKFKKTLELNPNDTEAIEGLKNIKEVRRNELIVEDLKRQLKNKYEEK